VYDFVARMKNLCAEQSSMDINEKQEQNIQFRVPHIHTQHTVTESKEESS
jgi:hypothetical protein